MFVTLSYANLVLFLPILQGHNYIQTMGQNVYLSVVQAGSDFHVLEVENA